MSTSGSDYEPVNDSHESSIDEEIETRSPRPSVASTSTRKRRRKSRSSSADSIPDVKYHLQGHYKDEYRSLFNETVQGAAARFHVDDSLLHRKAQIGTSIWTSEEKSVFFAALERLGKDDIPGIAKAIGSKTIPEVRHFALLLHDASSKQANTNVTLRDIPAATEIGQECSGRLELAGDALAWYQERFEAKTEQERYGNYWLITPKIAEEIEDALIPSRRPSLASSVPPGSGDEQSPEAAKDVSAVAPILQDIPEANILNVFNMLKLSSTLFMNGSPNPPSWFPHWSTHVSPLASNPSIYRTALVDFHALVVSLTKRLIQASIIQATSRIRSQGWRVKKGVNPLIKKRDVHTAIDMLRLQRNGRERWAGVARRCGLRVFEGAGRQKREVNWAEAEEILKLTPKFADAVTTDEETPGVVSGAEEDFKTRATRSGTPLPSRNPEDTGSDNEDNSGWLDESEPSDTDGSQIGEVVIPTSNPDESELKILEAIDHNASREEEIRLWGILGILPPSELASSVKVEDEAEESNLERSRNAFSHEEDWRSWTDYRAEWEELPVPVPLAMFQANQKSPSPGPLPSTRADNSALDTETGLSTGAEEVQGGRRRKRRKVTEVEIPIRGARAYAALQERMSSSEDQEAGLASSGEDDAKWPAPSIEDGSLGITRAGSLDRDDMEWDAKPATNI